MSLLNIVVMQSMTRPRVDLTRQPQASRVAVNSTKAQTLLEPL